MPLLKATSKIAFISNDSDVLIPMQVNDKCFAKCTNDKCSNFTTTHDLAGSWCSISCIVEFETGERPDQNWLTKYLFHNGDCEDREY